MRRARLVFSAALTFLQTSVGLRGNGQQMPMHKTHHKWAKCYRSFCVKQLLLWGTEFLSLTYSRFTWIKCKNHFKHCLNYCPKWKLVFRGNFGAFNKRRSCWQLKNSLLEMCKLDSDKCVIMLSCPYSIPVSSISLNWDVVIISRHEAYSRFYLLGRSMTAKHVCQQ